MSDSPFTGTMTVWPIRPSSNSSEILAGYRRWCDGEVYRVRDTKVEHCPPPGRSQNVTFMTMSPFRGCPNCVLVVPKLMYPNPPL